MFFNVISTNDTLSFFNISKLFRYYYVLWPRASSVPVTFVEDRPKGRGSGCELSWQMYSASLEAQRGKPRRRRSVQEVRKEQRDRRQCHQQHNMATNFYELSANLLSGGTLNFSSLRGKVVLIENVASLWGTTTRDYTQMNELHDRYAGQGLVILGVPCNQFGHQVGPSYFILHHKD